METYAQIKNNLKALRLGAMLENIELRIKEAIETKMSFSDFLLILTQDEQDRRKQKRKEQSIKRAGLGNYKHIVEFDFNFNPGISRQKIMDFIIMCLKA